MKHRNVIAALVVAACLWVGCSSAFAADLVWQTSKADAFILAKSQGKKVLLLAGNKCCDLTEYMRYTGSELTSPADIKGLIEQHYIPWYGGAYYSVKGCVGDALTSDWYDYAQLGWFTMPLIAVIDPNTDKRLDYSTGITPRVAGDSSKFDAQEFYDRLLKYTTETPASCTYNISPSGHAFNASSNAGTINVTPSSSDCAWTAEQCFVDNDYSGECRYREWNGFLFRIRQYNGKHQDRNHDHWREDLHRYTEWLHNMRLHHLPNQFSFQLFAAPYSLR